MTNETFRTGPCAKVLHGALTVKAMAPVQPEGHDLESRARCGWSCTIAHPLRRGGCQKHPAVQVRAYTFDPPMLERSGLIIYRLGGRGCRRCPEKMQFAIIILLAAEGVSDFGHAHYLVGRL